MKTNNATTFQSRCRLAATYVERYLANPGSIWIAIGKTTAWVDENNPPLPSLTANRVPELHGLVYVHTCKSVYTNPEGNLITPSGNFTAVNSTNPDVLASAKANKVFFEGHLKPGLLTGSYRVQALCTDVVFNTDLPTLLPGVFMPASSVSYYFLDWISLRTPIASDATSTQVIQLIREL